MKLRLHLRGVPRPDDLRDFARRRLERRLGHTVSAVRSIALSIRDINGPRGGDDMQGKLVLETIDGRSLVLEELRPSAMAATSALALAARRQLQRHLDRIVDRRRRGVSDGTGA